MYYCLIASLEQYTLHSDTQRIDFALLREQIAQELSVADSRIVSLLYAYYDVVNLIAALSGGGAPHNVLGNLSERQIAAEIAADANGGGDSDDDMEFVSLLPESVRYQLDMIKGRVEVPEGVNVDPDNVERLLLSNFYAQCQRANNSFLRSYIHTDRAMRNIIAGEHHAIGSLDESVGEAWWYDWLGEVLATKDFVDREHKFDALRWRIVDELIEPGQEDQNGHYFDLAVVLNYSIKLNILQRWAMLNKERGRERFEQAVGEFTKKGVVSEKEMQ